MNKKFFIDVWRWMLRTSWWWGMALFAFVATSLPYWLWGIFGSGRGWDVFFRTPVMPNAIFDSYAYYQQIGVLAAERQTDIFGWFSWPLLELIRLLPHASIPEIWIVSRWVMTCLLFWIGAWCIRIITGRSKQMSRLLIVCLWLSFLLVIGLRPGVFSWYLPFGFLGLGLTYIVSEALQKNQWIKAVAYSLAAFFLFTIYPWFLIYGMLLLVVLFAAHIIQVRSKLWVVLVISAVLALSGVAVLVASGAISLHVSAASLAMYERNGITFSRMPLISNTILACVLWLLLLWSRCFWRKSNEEHSLREFLSLSWTAVIFAWLSAPFVGVFFQSDHFIIVVVMLSWLNVAAYVAPHETSVEKDGALPQRSSGENESLQATSGAGQAVSIRAERCIFFSIAIFSSVFFVYILQKVLRQIGDVETYLIHLSIWLSLAWSAWVCWFSARGRDVHSWWKKLRWLLLIICFSLGAIGLSAVIKRGMKEMPVLGQHLATIDWIRSHVPSHEVVCSDPVNADIYGAHDAHVTYPDEADIFLKETNDIWNQKVVAFGSVYDATAAGDTERFAYMINGSRTMSCLQFAKAGKLLERLHVSRKAIDVFFGCRQDRADAFEREVLSAIAEHRVNASAFRAMCPWVVIPDDRKPYWNLPGSYEEIRIDQQTSIWHAK